MYHYTLITVFTFLFGFGVVGTSTSVIRLPESCPEECPLRLLDPQVTLVIDRAGTETIFHKNCILKCTHTRLLYAIASGLQTLTKDDSDFLRQISEHRHVVLFVNRLDVKSSLRDAMRKIRHNPWSIIFMVFLRENKRIACEGFTNHEVFTQLKQLFNYLWSELYVINVIASFPLICPNKYITYGEKYYDNSTYTYGRTIRLVSSEDVLRQLLTKTGPMVSDLMKDFPLRASIFYRFPTSIKECENIKYYVVLKSEHSGGYCGLDGLIMAEIVGKFRFKLSLIRPKGYQTYGFVNNQGKITGTLGNIARREADIAFNSRFLTDYGTTGFRFLMYSSSDALCAIVNRPKDIPLWLFPYVDVYDGYVFMCTIFSFIACAVFLWLTQRFFAEGKRKLIRKLHEIVLDVTVAGTFGFSLTRRKVNIILKASCLFSSTVFMATFQGHVNYAFTTIEFEDDIRTLKDLYNSGLTIITSPSVKTFMEHPYNELQSSLIDRMVIGDENRTLQETLSSERQAALERRTDILIQIQKYHTDERGAPLFNVVEECFRTYYLSIIARPEFPFMEQVEVVMERLQAAGLPAKYYEWTRHSLSIRKPTQTSGMPVPRPAEPVRLADLRIAFSVLLIGYIISCTVLIVERTKCTYYSYCSPR